MAGATFVDLAVVLLRRARARDNHHDLAICMADTHHWLTRIIPRAGMRVVTSGTMPPPGAFIAPNHMGYLDIFALGAAVPCFFVSKSEVASWPFIGYLLRASRHILVRRVRSKDIQDTVAEMAQRLQSGFTLCTFLEGTSSGGEDVLPFRAPLLQAAIDAGAPIVPTAIQWRAADPAIDIAEDVAYWKDHAFAPHLLRVLGLNGIEAHIRFGAVIHPAGMERKALAALVQNQVARLRA